MKNADGKFVAESALDAVAHAEERVGGSPELLAVHIMLVLRTPKGVRVISSLKEKYEGG
jgi:hypothetical protein